jgi:hypothetical protein
MVADNDLALDRIVEALTHSRFWPSAAIMVVEDDAQAGVDHVDGHRTVAFAISPFTRRGYVDSTFDSQTCMMKTIELMLGIPSLTVFDRIATDVGAAFQDQPDLSPYVSVVPKQSLFDLNPPLKATSDPARKAARASVEWRWDVPDAAPPDQLNRHLGRSKGLKDAVSRDAERCFYRGRWRCWGVNRVTERSETRVVPLWAPRAVR